MPLDKNAPLGHNEKWQTVVETHPYLARIKGLLSSVERDWIVDCLAKNPLVGDIISGTGGVRKVRFGKGSRGKSGGVRVIYYYYNREIPVFLLDIYGKNEKENLSKAERNAMATFIAETKRRIKK